MYVQLRHTYTQAPQSGDGEERGLDVRMPLHWRTVKGSKNVVGAG